MWRDHLDPAVFRGDRLGDLGLLLDPWGYAMADVILDWLDVGLLIAFFLFFAFVTLRAMR